MAKNLHRVTWLTLGALDTLNAFKTHVELQELTQCNQAPYGSSGKAEGRPACSLTTEHGCVSADDAAQTLWLAQSTGCHAGAAGTPIFTKSIKRYPP